MAQIVTLEWIGIDERLPSESATGLTRAEVTAAFLAARAAGQIPYGA